MIFINNIQLLILEICKENNIKYTVISNGWVLVLEKDNKVRIIAGYKFDLNKNGTSNVFDDKFATYELLDYYKIPVIEQRLLYGSNNKEEYTSKYKSYEYLLKYFNKYKDIVIKRNDGTCGIDVFHITKKDELDELFDNIKDKEISYSMSPFYKIENEYRTIVLNGEIRLIHKKSLPIVYGDGKSTIKDLLVKFNSKFFKDLDIENGNKVLPKNEKYQYDWRFNLCNGSVASFDIDDDVLDNINKIVSEITSLFDVKFCSIDIIKTVDNKYYVLEINSGVMMSHLLNENPDYRETIKEIYTEAINMQFE